MTAAQLAAVNRRRAQIVRTEMRKSLRGLGSSMVAYCRERLTEEIYAIPEDVTSTGKKKWKRTRQLLKGEQYELREPDSVAVINKTPYAEPRHEAGKPGHRKINPLRVSHWRDELVTTFRPIVTDVARLTLQAIIRRGAA